MFFIIVYSIGSAYFFNFNTIFSEGTVLKSFLSSQGRKEIFENKKRHGFNTTDMNEEFCHLIAEVGEAYDAWFRGKNTFAEELADVAIFLLGIAEMKGIDLQKEIERKEKINENRECVTNELGHRVHKT